MGFPQNKKNRILGHDSKNTNDEKKFIASLMTSVIIKALKN
jgi:hypothetical protein